MCRHSWDILVYLIIDLTSDIFLIYIYGWNFSQNFLPSCAHHKKEINKKSYILLQKFQESAQTLMWSNWQISQSNFVLLSSWKYVYVRLLIFYFKT